MYIPDFPATLSADAQFEILQTVLNDQIERVEKLPADPNDKQYNGPKYHGKRIIDDLLNRLLRLPCEKAAQNLIAELTADPKNPNWSWLPGFLS